MNYIHTLDIAHPPVTSDEAEIIVQTEIRKIKNSNSLRVLKIIHGYGSKGRGGTLKEVVRNWLFKHRNDYRAVIAGENASIFNSEILKILQTCGTSNDDDLRVSNLGLTIVWVK